MGHSDFPYITSRTFTRCGQRRFAPKGSALSAVAVELVVADAAAAEPLPPGSVLLGEAGSHESGRAFFRRIAFFGVGGILLGRDEEADLHRRNGKKLFVDQPVAGHVSI